jgi:hypothetical protein
MPAGWADCPTPCMPCSVAPCRRSRSGPCAQPNGLLRVTVTDRWIPLVTAAYGTRMARPARTTTLAHGGDGSRLVRRVRPSSVTTASWASREAARQYLAVSSGRRCFGTSVFRPETGWLAAPVRFSTVLRPPARQLGRWAMLILVAAWTAVSFCNMIRPCGVSTTRPAVL